MKNKKNKMQALLIIAFLGVTAGCGTRTLLQEETTTQTAEAYTQPSKEASTNENACEEQFKIYEPFGMVYDAGENKLYYKGKAVRWFEDYYPLGGGSRAGRDFFNENGEVDVYAVRDLHTSARSDDGSFDPSGTLTGLMECSEEEFAARDLEGIKNPAPVTAIAGEPASLEELQEIAREYEAFGLTYDALDEQWYFHGEKVRYFNDWRRGASFTNFSTGVIDIEGAYDENDNLIGIQECSQEMYDFHTKKREALFHS